MAKKNSAPAEMIPDTDTGKFFHAMGKMEPDVFLRNRGQGNAGTMENISAFSRQWLFRTQTMKAAVEEEAKVKK